MLLPTPSIGSSSRVRGAKKHEIDVAAFGGHLFYDLFVQGWGALAPSAPPGSATATPALYKQVIIKMATKGGHIDFMFLAPHPPPQPAAGSGAVARLPF